MSAAMTRFSDAQPIYAEHGIVTFYRRTCHLVFMLQLSSAAARPRRPVTERPVALPPVRVGERRAAIRNKVD
jgi:hypothetical protein